MAPPTPFRRHPRNPLLRATDVGGDVALVFNPGVVRFGDRYLMAYRADRGEPGNPNLVATDLGFAWSDDALDWHLDAGSRPSAGSRLDRQAAIELLQPLEPQRDLEAELWRLYDPRLTVVERDGGERLLMSFAVDTTHGLRAGLAESEDGITWRALALGSPDNRNQVVFSEPMNGQWARLERPMNGYGGPALGAERYGIWLSRSPDLIHWGQSRFLGGAELFGFADDKIGPGAPPLRTEAGWLCFVHTVSAHPTGGQRGWEPSWGKVYQAAALLLDLDDPSRIVAAAQTPVLSPDPAYPYETKGFRNDVVFPTGALLVGSEVWLYYGAADTCVALATAPLDDVLTFVAGERG